MAAAQASHDVVRPATAAEVIGGNVLISGVIAATRALLSDADPFRAFAFGAMGGAVHITGKNLTVEPGAAKAWTGLVIASTGASMVSNAGRGRHVFDEISIPVAAARLRVTPFEHRKVRMGLNLFESVIMVRHGVRDGLELDWSGSLARGALVFIAENRRITVGDEEFWGFAVAPTAVVSSLVPDVDALIRHEIVHVHQQWFLQETIGRPLESALRDRVKFARLIPSWLEIGVVGPSTLLVDGWATNGKGLGRLLEAEAELLERR